MGQYRNTTPMAERGLGHRQTTILKTIRSEGFAVVRKWEWPVAESLRQRGLVAVSPPHGTLEDLVRVLGRGCSLNKLKPVDEGFTVRVTDSVRYKLNPAVTGTVIKMWDVEGLFECDVLLRTGHIMSDTEERWEKVNETP